MASETSRGVEIDRRFEAARAAVTGRRLVDLPVERLELLRERLDQQAELLAADLEGVGRSADAALEAGDYLEYQRLRGVADDVVRRFNELHESRRRVQDARAERQLTDRMMEFLGSAVRLRVYDGVMMALIMVVVGMLGLDLAVGLSARTALVFDILDVAVCGVFIVDFFWRMSLADDRGWFWRHSWLDLVTSIPVPTSPLRAGRVVRLARLLRVVRLIRAVRIVLYFWRGIDPLLTALNMQMLRRSFGVLLALLVAGGVGIYLLEGGSPTPDGVEDIGQSLWWSFTTVVTGGFGDLHNPTTIGGRALTVLLIIAGVVVGGVFTATLTSVLVREEETTAAVLALDDRLDERLSKLEERLGVSQSS